MNENTRIKTLKKYEILDTPKDSALDRITELASKILNVPISIISLVDSDRIWFKSAFGLEASEIALEAGLCASAILVDEIYMVENARNDPRSKDNSLVTSAFGLQFYTGVPLTVENGANLGTLCIIDQKPRTLTAKEQDLLKDLAGLVVEQLEVKHSVRQCVINQLEMSNMLQSIYESTQETSTFIDKDLIVQYTNHVSKSVTQELFDKEIKVGDCFLNFVLPQFKEEFTKAFKRVIKGERIDVEKTDGTTWWRVAMYPVYDKTNTIVGIAHNNQDITVEKNNIIKLVQQNEVLKEIAWQQCHEVRGPVANILGFCNLLKDNDSNTLEEQKKYINHLSDATQELDKIIHKIVGQSVQRYKDI